MGLFLILNKTYEDKLDITGFYKSEAIGHRYAVYIKSPSTVSLDLAVTF